MTGIEVGAVLCAVAFLGSVFGAWWERGSLVRVLRARRRRRPRIGETTASAPLVLPGGPYRGGELRLEDVERSPGPRWGLTPAARVAGLVPRLVLLLPGKREFREHVREWSAYRRACLRYHEELREWERLWGFREGKVDGSKPIRRLARPVPPSPPPKRIYE